MSFKKNTAVTGFPLGLISSTDGSAITTGTPVGYYILDGGTQTAIADVTPVHEGQGTWTFDLTAGEMNGDIVGLTFTHASAIPAYFTIKTDTKIVSELQDLTAAQVNTEADTALTDYDGPTNTEMIARTLVAADYFDPAVDTVATVTSVTNQVTADVTAISGDTAAADNLEAQYDGTGYTDSNAPATQAQVGNLATGSAAISTIAESRVLTVGTEVNSYTDTATVNGIYNEITSVGNAFDMYYQFDVGGNGVAVDVTMTGRLAGSNDSLDVFAYNWDGASWDQIGNMQGSNGTTDGVTTFSLLTRHTGSGANLGKVRIRGYEISGLTSATLYIDQAYVSYSVVSNSVGYALGRVWINTIGGTAGTESFVNGVADNKVLTFADALTIAGNVGLSEYELSPDSTLSPAADLNNANVYGIGYSLNLGGHDYAGTHFYHASPVNGVATAQNVAGQHLDILDSIIIDVTVDDAHFTNCSMGGTVTLSATQSGELKAVNCRSIIAGASTPILDFNTGVGISHDVTFANWQNGLEVRNFNNQGTDRFSISGTGKLIVANTCSGTMHVRGPFRIEDNSGGNVTFIYDDLHENSHSILEDTGTTLPATLAALNDITVADILASGDVDGYTVEETLKLVLAALAGKLSGAASTTLTIRAADDSKSRLIATVDSDGNRSAITVDATG